MSLWAWPLSACGVPALGGGPSIPELLNMFLLFLSQDLHQGSEEHAVSGQLPGPQHEVPAGETHGECVTSFLFSAGDPVTCL